MLGGADQKALFDYWHDRVRLTNLTRLGAREHVTTQELRHECTNYDEVKRIALLNELETEYFEKKLSESGKVKPCRTIRRLTPHELSVTNEVEKDKRSRFTQGIRRMLGDSLRAASGQIDTSLDPVEEETVDEMYQIWLDDSEDFGGYNRFFASHL